MTIAKRASSLQTLANEHLQKLSLSKAKSTIAAYTNSLTGFISWLEIKRIRKADKVTAQHIIEFLSFKKSSGSSPSTIKGYFLPIRTFFVHLRRSKVIDQDVTEFIDAPKGDKVVARVPTIEQIQALLDIPNMDDWLSIRDRAILELMYSSGLRASEVCAMQLRDVTETAVHVASGKGDKTRSVPLTAAASFWLQQYITRCRDIEGPELWQTDFGSNFTRFQLFAMVRKRSRQVGIEDCSPHTLRHACATHLLDQGADVRLIQEVLGHANISSTQRYTQLSSARVHSMFSQYHPRKHGQAIEL